MADGAHDAKASIEGVDLLPSGGRDSRGRRQAPPWTVSQCGQEITAFPPLGTLLLAIDALPIDESRTNVWPMLPVLLQRPAARRLVRTNTEGGKRVRREGQP